MRVLLLCAVATMAVSACNQGEPTDKAQHADAVRQTPPAASAPAAAGAPGRNVPGGGSGTAASDEQASGPEAERGKEVAPPPPKR